MKHLFTPLKKSTVPQFISFKNLLNETNFQLDFIHKTLWFLKTEKEKIYIKINVLDGEYYVFSSNQPLLIFDSFVSLKNWMLKKIS